MHSLETVEPAAARRARLLEIIQRFSKSGAELAEGERRAADRGYWLSLNPGLTIESPVGIEWDGPPGSPEPTGETIASYRENGFLSMNAVLSVAQVEKMRKVVETLRAADWPAVFSFIYDDFWLIGQAATVKTLLIQVLHPCYRLLPRLWTHYVSAARGSSGWVPHLDHPDESGHTTSIWIPLSHATLSNGCMHIVKRSKYSDAVCRAYHARSTFTRSEVETLLRDVRALPMNPGGILAWDDKILHWGGRFEGGSEPRISLALEFTTPDFVPPDGSESLIDPQAPLPSFESRLRLISHAVLSYRRFEPMLERFAPLAMRFAPGG
jgi:hypothetical protein